MTACEWPGPDGVHRCGETGPTVHHWLAPRGKWGRWVCATHAKRARRLGWTRA